MNRFSETTVLGTAIAALAIQTMLAATGAARTARSEPLAAAATGQHDHAAMASASFSGETGQAAFAALAEVVRTLQDDPSTDWSRVSMTDLREHLVDMDALVLRAEVDERPLADGLLMTVRGDDAALEAARRMLPAHGRALEAERGWRVVVSESPDPAVRFTVRGVEEGELELVRGLGFFGILTLGAHHDVHHVMIARGGSH